MNRRAALTMLAAAGLPLGLPNVATAKPVPVPWPRTQATPAFELDALGGQPVSLAALRGRPLLLNFWASWCEPCRAEMPSLELLESRHASAGLKVLAINFRETDGTVKRFVEQTGLSLTVLRDRDGGVARDYGVKIYPTTIAVDRTGRARFAVIGEIDWLGPDAARWLRPLLDSRVT
ncbi:MAG: TlpA family protein disulfide reductase [Burkholderiales bacterium]|nr:TlpA family protein disulfide reductase [Burkholderiales bacterium]